MSANYETTRLVISGAGGITPIGESIKLSNDGNPTAWDNAIAGISGITRLEETDIFNHPGHENLPLQVGAGIKTDISKHPYILENRKASKMWGRAGLMAAIATNHALQSANFDSETIDPYRISHYFGSVFGANGHSHEVNLDRVPPPDGTKNLFAQVGLGPDMLHGFKGRGAVIAAECASGALAVESGIRDLLPQYYGGEMMPPKADMAIVGGTDATLVPIPLRIFVEAFKGAADKGGNPDEVSLPFDVNAHGLAAGEGSTVLVIEPWEKAQARGLSEDDIIAEIAGFESLTDANTIVLAGIEGQVRAMARALEMAKISLEQTIYINGHATSTLAGDAREALAIRELIRRLNLDPEQVYVSSIKSMTGHTMGAAGALELYITAMAAKYGIIPQSAKMTQPIAAAIAPVSELSFEGDSNKDLSDLIKQELPQLKPENFSPRQSTEANIDIAISNSFGFAGGAVALAVKKFKA